MIKKELSDLEILLAGAKESIVEVSNVSREFVVESFIPTLQKLGRVGKAGLRLVGALVVPAVMNSMDIYHKREHPKLTNDEDDRLTVNLIWSIARPVALGLLWGLSKFGERAESVLSLGQALGILAVAFGADTTLNVLYLKGLKKVEKR